MKAEVCVLLGVLVGTQTVVAHPDAPDSTGIVEPLPILSYDTDTGLGYGLKVVFRNTLGQRESFDLVLFNSTKGERWYRFVFSLPDLELRQGTTYPIALDLILDYDKWIKNSFFGIGRDSRFDDREYYTKEPLEISAALSRGFSHSFVGQFGARFKAIRNFAFQADSRLVNLGQEISRSRASFFSVFTTLRYDTRDTYLNPSRGLVIQGDAEYAPESALGNVAFHRFALWLQSYSSLSHLNAVLALRLGLQSLGGDNLPVQVLMTVGGNRDLRGSPQDRYLDKVSAVVNGEIRFPIIWRLGGVAGLDAGSVFGSTSKITASAWTANPTAGLRFFMETFVVRLDVGFGGEGTGFYFNFGQIF